MTTIIKLTDQNGCTRNGTRWGPGMSHKATGDPSQPLCTDGWIHGYENALIAVLMNPIHANFENPRIWKAEGEVGLRNGQLKCGCRELTVICEIELPKITTVQRVAFAILCAKEVYEDPTWNKWADDWLSGRDRSAVEDAVEAARAAWVARARAAWVAWAGGAWAAAAAAWAADAAVAAYAGNLAEAAVAAYAGNLWAGGAWEAEAAEAAAARIATIDFVSLAQKALTME